MEDSPFKLIYDKSIYEARLGNTDKAKEILCTGSNFADYIFHMSKVDFEARRKLFVQRCRIVAKHSQSVHAKIIRELANKVEKDALFFALSATILAMELDAWFWITVGTSAEKHAELIYEMNAMLTPTKPE